MRATRQGCCVGEKRIMIPLMVSKMAILLGSKLKGITITLMVSKMAIICLME
jgi:hypothetical protein